MATFICKICGVEENTDHWINRKELGRDGCIQQQEISAKKD